MASKQEALVKVETLIERFTEQYDSYKSSGYNETLTRRDFIDPFFKALGWDIDNENGYAEAYREVVHEDKIKISGKLKAPDYSFKLAGGKRLFFVEAKKPSILIKEDIVPAYQLRRYGWNDKLAISIITDFEEFAVYDCTKKPNPKDKASTARIKYISYTDYVKEFDFIWDTFSKEAVLKGRFDKFVKSDTLKKGTATVDNEFLKSLDTWRTLLATNIAKQNKQLDEDELNFVVQQTIDRIIFLRIAEDRGIEPYENLKASYKISKNYYRNLFGLFNEADDKYNSGLFDFKKDSLSKNIEVENAVVKNIIDDLYYPNSPYEFSVLSVEILGSAYEQFLGKQIKIDSAHRATIEEKPEVRKAGGVYYTPQYIVDYIVENTIGKQIEGKTPKQIADFKIVDPACGSGSFLLGAYQYLLTWHKDFYTNKGKLPKNKKDNPITPDGNLTTAEKKRILLNNIYGVDIDVNAVEVTKLSLLLKCMEGETQASINHQLGLLRDRVLPSLENNIKSGNSLIDTDIYDQELDFGEERKIKPFSWKNAFPQVFENSGGFDAVIGNPPYVRQELLGNQQKEYYKNHYKVYHGTADLYSYFFEKAMRLLKPKGLFGIIVANKWMRANYGEPLRRWLLDTTILEIIDFGDLPVFQTATAYPCIFINSNTAQKTPVAVTQVKTLDFENGLQHYVQQNTILVEQKSLSPDGWNLSPAEEQDLLKKIENAGTPLGDYVKGKIFRGVLTGLNEAFVIDETTQQQLIKEHKSSAEIIKPFLAGRDIKRYQPLHSDKYLIFTKRGIDIDKYPAIKKYLENFKTQLMPKPKDFKGEDWKGRKKGSYKWYEIQDAVDYYPEFEKPKIIIPDIAIQMQATYSRHNFYCANTAYIVPVDDIFLLGIINSKLVHYFYSKISTSIRGGYLRFIRQYLELIPIIVGTEKNLQQEIIKNVELLLQLNQELYTTNLQTKKEQLQQRIQYADDKINQAVYKLYDLTEEEIQIIETAP